MVRITNNKDTNLRYLISGTMQEKAKFDEVVRRMKLKGYTPSIVFPFGNKMHATYRFESKWDKERFRSIYNSEREAMKESMKARTA